MLFGMTAMVEMCAGERLSFPALGTRSFIEIARFFLAVGTMNVGAPIWVPLTRTHRSWSLVVNLDAIRYRGFLLMARTAEKSLRALRRASK